MSREDLGGWRGGLSPEEGARKTGAHPWLHRLPQGLRPVQRCQPQKHRLPPQGRGEVPGPAEKTVGAVWGTGMGWGCFPVWPDAQSRLPPIGWNVSAPSRKSTGRARWASATPRMPWTPARSQVSGSSPQGPRALVHLCRWSLSASVPRGVTQGFRPTCLVPCGHSCALQATQPASDCPSARVGCPPPHSTMGDCWSLKGLCVSLLRGHPHSP